MGAIFWFDNDKHKHLVDSLFFESISNVVSFKTVESFNSLIETSRQQAELNFVFTLVDLNSLEALYQIQQYQENHPDIPVLAIFKSQKDTSEEVSTRLIKLLINTIERIEKKDSEALDNECHHMKSQLTKRQLEVLALVRYGKSNKQIAKELNLSPGTVKLHCMAIFRLIGAANRVEAALMADKFFNACCEDAA